MLESWFSRAYRCVLLWRMWTPSKTEENGAKDIRSESLYSLSFCESWLLDLSLVSHLIKQTFEVMEESATRFWDFLHDPRIKLL